MKKDKPKEELKPEKEEPTPNAIMNPDERRELLSRIARGEMTILKPVVINKAVKQVTCAPDYTERKNAMAELNKMDGIYSRKEPQQEEQVHIITAEDIE